MKTKTLILFLLFWASWIAAEPLQSKCGRLLVNIDSKASFSPEEFAISASAELIVIDTRNSFKAFDHLFLERPFVVISAPLEEKVVRKLASDNGYRFVTFVQESLEEAKTRAYELLRQIPKKSSEILPLSPSDSKKIYALMEKIDRVFTKNQLTYWAGGGTLLGAVRHGGLIPWDDDLDIYILDSDGEKLIQMEKALEEAGLKLHRYFKDTYKIFDKEAASIPDPNNPEKPLPFGYPAADIFTMVLQRRNEKSDTYILKSRIFYWEWTNDRTTYSQIQNIHRIPFGPLMLPVPGDPETTLNLLYGMPEFPDLWKKYAFEPTWDHSREILFPQLNGAGALVEMDDFSPAPWE